MSRKARFSLGCGGSALLVVIVGVGLLGWGVVGGELERAKHREARHAFDVYQSQADRTPQWLSHGKSLVVNMRHSIWQVDMASGEARRIHDDTSIGRYSARLSPNDHTVAYLRYYPGRYRDRRQIEITDLSGREPIQLGSRAAFTSTVWSADGSRFLYGKSSPERETIANTDSNFRVALFSETEPEISWPIRWPQDSRAASWSPDGSHIAFSGQSDQWDYVLYVVKSDGTDKVVLYNSNDLVSAPVWVGENQVMFTASQQTGDTTQTKLYRIGIDGQSLQTLGDLPTAVDRYGRASEVFRIVPSPDGSRFLVFVLFGSPLNSITYDEGAHAIYVWRVGDDEFTELQTIMPHYASYYAAWSPDGERIAIVSVRVPSGGGRDVLFTVSSDGGEYRHIHTEFLIQPAN